MTAFLADPRLAAFASAIISWVGNALFFGTVLALLTWLALKLVGRRLHPALHGALWMIVLVKFLLPVGPSWSYSLASGVNAVSKSWHALSSPDALQPTPSDPSPDLVLIDTKPAASPQAAVPNTAFSWSQVPIAALIAAAYCVGALIAISIRLMSYLRFAALCRAFPLANSATRAAVETACRRLGVRRLPAVHLSHDAPAPFIFGVFRPRLVLSQRHLHNADELEAVILHEIAHLRRGDLIVRYLQWSAGTLLFFWPVVAWVNRRIDLAREHACDEWALRHGRLTAGAYARCLLDAVHTASARRFTYRPAAMAANVFTVKRRIEMILESAPGPKRSALGVPSILAALAWSGFVLTGVAVAEDPAPQGAATQKKVVVVTADGDGQNVNVDVREGAGDKPCVWFDKKTGSVADINMARARFSIPNEKDLAAFLTNHPTADANLDGKLSLDERNAFLVALAMRNPAGVLQRFPNADLDANGQLDASEAAQLVGGGVFVRRIASDGENPAQAKEDVMMFRVAVRANGTDAKDAPRASLTNPRDAANWILDNVKVEPPVAEVTQYVEVVQQAPFAQILKEHPEADTDGDGKLSPAEHEALMANEQEHVGKLLFKHFPEADTNGDGIISRDEMRNLKGRRKIVMKSSDGATTTDENILIDGDQQEHQVIILQNDAGDSDQK